MHHISELKNREEPSEDHLDARQQCSPSMVVSFVPSFSHRIVSLLPDSFHSVRVEAYLSIRFGSGGHRGTGFGVS